MRDLEPGVEDGLRVFYWIAGDGTRHRYEETPEYDEQGLAIYRYTGVVNNR